MGGRALKIKTKRCSVQEYQETLEEIKHIISDDFKYIDSPSYYRNKEDFGDIDVVIADDYSLKKINIGEYIIEKFNPIDIFHNGNCWSFDFKNIQIDFIIVTEEEFNSTLEYYNWNDLGNLIGRLAHTIGFKYGQSGLWYEHYYRDENIGKIIISKDIEKICDFLGLSYKTYQKGFDNLEEMFQFISKSQYFNWKKYQLKELNRINRERNLKRKTYLSFLNWIDKNVKNDNYLFVKDNKIDYLKLAMDKFPEVNIKNEINKLEYIKIKNLYVKSKFSIAEYLIEKNIEKNNLNKIICYLKDNLPFNYHNDFNDYIINTNNKIIKSDIDFLIQNPNFKFQ